MHVVLSTRFKTLWDSYPDHGFNMSEFPDCHFVDNQCALKMSVAFHRSRFIPDVIPEKHLADNFNTWKRSVRRSLGSSCTMETIQVITGAEPLARLMKEKNYFGQPRIFKKGQESNKRFAERVMGLIYGKSGIILFKDYWHRTTEPSGVNTGDHIDLWNGQRTKTNPDNTSNTIERASQVWLFY